MNIFIFNRKYWVRRFDEQQIIGGFAHSNYTDMVVSIHVHPAGNDQVQANPEGLRVVNRVDGHGMEALQTASESKGNKGDLLYYGGRWYECTSSVLYDHTLLSHYNYSFTLVPVDASGSNDLEYPVGDPI